MTARPDKPLPTRPSAGLGLRTSAVATPAFAPPADLSGVESSAGNSSQFRLAVSNATRKFALNFTLLFIFFRFSFLHEFVASKYNIDTHTLLVVGGLCYLTALLSGTLFAGVKRPGVSMWLLFGVCMCMATVTSSWRGGSVQVLLPYLRTTLPLILLIPAVAYTSKDIQKMIDTIGFAGAVTIVIGLLSSDFRSGRLGMSTAGGSIQDPNDYAAHMLLIAPAIAYWTLRPGRNVAFKLVGLCFLPACLFEFLSTGSRGGLIGLIVTGLYIFTKGSSRLRMGLLFGIPLLLAFALPFVPGEAEQRLSSLFNSKDATEEAADSESARILLLKASLNITFHHPLLGIGPGEFEDYQGGIAAENGEHGLWHATHNTYTQVSSECGIPATIFFVAGIFLAYRSLRKSKKANIVPLSSIAQTLSIMLVGYCACLCFLSQAYSFTLLVLAGLAVSIERLIEENAQQPPGVQQVHTAALRAR